VPTAAEARAVYDEVRAVFRNSLKSDNKRYTYAYVGAGVDKTIRRNRNQLLARPRIIALRVGGRIGAPTAIWATDPKERAGNCDEFAYLAVHAARCKGIQGIWTATTAHASNVATEYASSAYPAIPGSCPPGRPCKTMGTGLRMPGLSMVGLVSYASIHSILLNYGGRC
jgi:hypothetical protein